MNCSNFLYIGATLNRGFNRAVGSFIAGVFAVVVIQITLNSGDKAAPYIIGLSIFLVGMRINSILVEDDQMLHGTVLSQFEFNHFMYVNTCAGAGTSFMKLWPSLVPYEYGFRVILFTYCLIIISSYRMGNPMKTAMDRLYSISIGAVVAVLVNVLIFPIWAGEQLHKELVSSFNTVADSLEGAQNRSLRSILIYIYIARVSTEM